MGHLVELLKDLREERDLAGVAVVATVAMVATLCLAPLTSAGAFVHMARFHRRGTYEGWVALQVVPSMYSFRNRIVLYPGVRQPCARLIGPYLGFRYVNHHLYRAVVNPIESLLPRSGCLTAVLLSDYRDESLRTDYVVCAASEGKTLDPPQLELAARWFSRAAVVTETLLATAFLLPLRAATRVYAALLTMTYLSAPWTVMDAMAPVFGLGLAALALEGSLDRWVPKPTQPSNTTAASKPCRVLGESAGRSQ